MRRKSALHFEVPAFGSAALSGEVAEWPKAALC